MPEAASALAPGIFAEPRDKDVSSEYQRQRAVLSFIRRHCPKVFVFAVPNAVRGEYAKLKQQREGAVYGAVDLVFTWPGGCAFVEMKDRDGRPAPNQIDFMNRLHAQGHAVGLCRTLAGVLALLHRAGAPVPAVRG